MSGRRPMSIIFFPNGNAAVCDSAGQQISRYQQGNHSDTIAALEADGFDWRKLDVLGVPMLERKP